MPNVISLHRRLDRLDANDGASIAEAMEQAHREHEARQAAWTAAGHLGAPPHRPIPPLSPDASHRCRGLWRMVAEGRARVIYGKAPDASLFASLASIYTLPDDAPLAAINSLRSISARNTSRRVRLRLPLYSAPEKLSCAASSEPRRLFRDFPALL